MKKVFVYIVIDKKGRIVSKCGSHKEARWAVWDKGDKIVQVPIDIKKGKVVR